MNTEENQPAHAEEKGAAESHPRQPEDAPADAGTQCSSSD